MGFNEGLFKYLVKVLLKLNIKAEFNALNSYSSLDKTYQYPKSS